MVIHVTDNSGSNSAPKCNKIATDQLFITTAFVMACFSSFCYWAGFAARLVTVAAGISPETDCRRVVRVHSFAGYLAWPAI